MAHVLRKLECGGPRLWAILGCPKPCQALNGYSVQCFAREPARSRICRAWQAGQHLRFLADIFWLRISECGYSTPVQRENPEEEFDVAIGTNTGSLLLLLDEGEGRRTAIKNGREQMDLSAPLYREGRDTYFAPLLLSR